LSSAFFDVLSSFIKHLATLFNEALPRSRTASPSLAVFRSLTTCIILHAFRALVNTISEKSIQFFQVVSNLPKACLTGTKKALHPKMQRLS